MNRALDPELDTVGPGLGVGFVEAVTQATAKSLAETQIGRTRQHRFFAFFLKKWSHRKETRTLQLELVTIYFVKTSRPWRAMRSARQFTVHQEQRQARCAVGI
jgi:hypothetical protein